MNLNQMKEKRAALIRDARAIIVAADAEGRALTADESRQFDAITNEADVLTRKVEAAEAQAEGHRRSIEGRLGRGDTDVTDRTVALTNEQRMEDWVAARGLDGGVEDPAALDFGRYVRGIALGDWRGAEAERRAMSEGTGSAGGFIVPTPLSARVIDKARSLTRVFQAGATTVPMSSQTLKMGRVSGDPTAEWKAENAAITASDITLEQIEFKAKTLIAQIKASRELVEDAQGLEDVIVNCFAEKLALELDRVALLGSGTGEEPKGLTSYASGVNVVSMGTNGAALTNWDKVLDAYQDVRDDNHEPNGAMILAPRTLRTVGGFKDTTNQPLRRPFDLESARLLSTTQVPITQTQGTATNASSIYLGNWAQLMYGIRSELHIVVLHERFSDNHQIGFTAWLRADVQLAHPEAFAIVKGITP